MKSFSYSITIFALLVIGCGSKKQEDNVVVTPLPVFDFSQITNTAFFSKQVRISGFVGDPFEYTYDLSNESDTSTRFYSLPLFERRNQLFAYPPLILSVRVGNEQTMNTILPLDKKYNSEDVKIIGQIGPDINVGDHVGVSGILINSSAKASLIVTSIAQLADSLTDYEQLGSLKFATANLATDSLKGKLVYAEGKIDVTELIAEDSFVRVLFRPEGKPDAIAIILAYGSQPSRIEELPELYKPSDLRIYDDKEKLVNVNLKVGLYGVWDGSSIWVENINNL